MEDNYSEYDLNSAKRYAKHVGGWVVRLIEEIVYEPSPDDGVVPFDPDAPDAPDAHG